MPTPLIVFAVNGSRYALRVAVVDRVVAAVALSTLPNAPEIALGIVNVHGRPVPVLEVRRRLGLASRYGVDTRLIIARTARRSVALAVDEVLGLVDVDDEAVERPSAVLPGLRQLEGVTAVADGVLLIYDLDRFLSLEEDEQLTAALDGL